MESQRSLKRKIDQVAKNVKKVANTPRSFKTKAPKLEFKFIDTSATIAASTLYPLSGTTAVVVPLNICLEGSSAITRVGRRASMYSFELHGSLSAAATTVGLPQQMKLELWYDKQTNGATPTGAAIYQSNAINSPRNLDNRDRFKCLKSETWPLGPATTANGGLPSTKKLEWYLRWKKPLETTYNGGNTGGIADINTGGLFLVATQDAFLGTTTVTGIMYGRVRFQD